MAKKLRKSKPRKPHSITYVGGNGTVLVVNFVCGLRYYHCPQYPQIAARFDGAGDAEANAAMEMFEQLTAVGDTKGAA